MLPRSRMLNDSDPSLRTHLFDIPREEKKERFSPVNFFCGFSLATLLAVGGYFFARMNSDGAKISPDSYQDENGREIRCLRYDSPIGLDTLFVEDKEGNYAPLK